MELTTHGGRRPAGVAFDLDGTLVLSEERSRACWRAFFTGRGMAFDDELASLVAGRRGADYFRDAADLFPGEEPEDLVREVLGYEETLGLPEPEPVAGAADLLRHLAAEGVPLAVVTSRHLPSTEQILTRLGGREHVTVLVTAERVTRGKPHPEGYLAAADLLGLEPARMTAFEDTVAGVRAARGAGMYCVGVAASTAPALLIDADADAVVPDLTGVRVAADRQPPAPSRAPTMAPSGAEPEETWSSAR